MLARRHHSWSSRVSDLHSGILFFIDQLDIIGHTSVYRFVERSGFDDFIKHVLYVKSVICVESLDPVTSDKTVDSVQSVISVDSVQSVKSAHSV